jgi:hypothetical protein
VPAVIKAKIMKMQHIANIQALPQN